MRRDPRFRPIVRPSLQSRLSHGVYRDRGDGEYKPDDEIIRNRLKHLSELAKRAPGARRIVHRNVGRYAAKALDPNGEDHAYDSFVRKFTGYRAGIRGAREFESIFLYGHGTADQANNGVNGLSLSFLCGFHYEYFGVITHWIKRMPANQRFDLCEELRDQHENVFGLLGVKDPQKEGVADLASLLWSRSFWGLDASLDAFKNWRSTRTPVDSAISDIKERALGVVGIAKSDLPLLEREEVVHTAILDWLCCLTGVLVPQGSEGDRNYREF